LKETIRTIGDNPAVVKKRDEGQALRAPRPPEARGGAAYVRKGAADLAIDDCGTAIQLNSGFAWAYFHRGTAYLSKGKPDLAIADFEIALLLEPNHVCAMGQLAREG